MLKRNLLRLLVILFAVIIIYFLKNNFTEYNLSKSISACILGQKQKSQSFNLEEAQKFCEKKLGK